MPHELPNNLRLRNLGIQEILGKCQILIELLASAFPPPEEKMLSTLVKTFRTTARKTRKTITRKAEIELLP